MNKKKTTSGFTLVELLVVIAIIALLVSILLPSLAKAREEAKKIRCLANLKDVGGASAAYANSDLSGFYIPVIPTLVNAAYVSASRRGFGGKSGLHFFDDTNFPDQPTWYGDSYGMWSTKNGFGPTKRPLNNFIYPANVGADYSYDGLEALDIDTAQVDEKLEFDVFKCPSDAGYNSARDGNTDVIFGYGSPGSQNNREFQQPVSLYDAMGNSYATDALLAGTSLPGVFSAYGAYFRKYEGIPNPTRVTAYIEGKGFYAAFWNDRVFGQEDSYTYGNHGENRTHMVGFGDGHAAPVQFEVQDDVIGFSPNGNAIHNGNYRLAGGTTGSIRFNTNPEDPLDLEQIAHLLLEGPGWQNHCQPAPPILTGSITW